MSWTGDLWLKDIRLKFEDTIKYFSKWEVGNQYRKPIRRVIFILDESLDESSSMKTQDMIQKEVLSFFSKNSMKIDKALRLPSYSAFKSKYPFLCISPLISGFSSRPEDQRKFLYSFTSFPSEIVADRIFLGRAIHVNNSKQLGDLGIKVVLDLQEMKEEERTKKAKVLLEGGVKYESVSESAPSEGMVDFDGVNETITKAIGESGRVMIAVEFIEKKRIE